MRRDIFRLGHRFDIEDADSVRESRKRTRILTRDRRRAENSRSERIVHGEEAAGVLLSGSVCLFDELLFLPQEELWKVPRLLAARLAQAGLEIRALF